MAFVHARQRWKRQPEGPLELDRSHPLGANLVFDWTALPVLRDNVTGRNGSALGAGVTPVATAYGKGLSFSGTQANATCTLGTAFDPLGGATELTLQAIASSDVAAEEMYFAKWGVTNQFLFGVTGTEVEFGSVNASIDVRKTSAAAMVSGRTYNVIYVWPGGAVLNTTAYIDGTPRLLDTNVFFNGTNTSLQNSTADNWQLGHKDDGNPLNGKILLARAWRKAHSAAAVNELRTNPWQIYKPLMRRIYVNTAAAGGTFKPFWAVQNNSVVGAGVH